MYVCTCIHAVNTHTHTHTHTHTWKLIKHYPIYSHQQIIIMDGSQAILKLKITSLPKLHSAVSLASVFKNTHVYSSKLPSHVGKQVFVLRFMFFFLGFWVLWGGGGIFLIFLIYFVLNVRQKLCIAIIGMNIAGLSCRIKNGRQLGWNHTVISRLVRKN